MSELEILRKNYESPSHDNFGRRLRNNKTNHAWVMAQTNHLPSKASLIERAIFLLTGEYLISLNSWAEMYEITYSTARSMALNGEIYSQKMGSGIRVRFDEIPPNNNYIECQICHKHVGQITGTHLQSHADSKDRISLDDYKSKFSGAPIVSIDTSNKISTKLTDRSLSENHKMNISLAKRNKNDV